MVPSSIWQDWVLGTNAYHWLHCKYKSAHQPLLGEVRMNVRVLVLGSTSMHECRSTGTPEYQYARMQEYWYSGGSTGTLYLFLNYVEVDLLSWGGRGHPNSWQNSLLSLLENNHPDKAFLDQTDVIIRTNAIGALLQQIRGVAIVSQSSWNVTPFWFVGLNG